MTPLKQLADHGQSVWIDYLSRTFVQDGDLAGLVGDGVVGVTSNPTIFQAAIAEGDAYDDQIRELVGRPRPTRRRSSSRSRATTSATPATSCAPSATRATARTARSRSRSTRTSRTTPRPRSTRPSACTRWSSARTCSSRSPPRPRACRRSRRRSPRGIPVNVTLIFSLERHREVAEAYIRGLQRLVESGGDPSKIASVASFFVSRVDTEADRRLDEIGGHDELKGKLAIANAKLAYQTYKEIFSGAQWDELAAKGATPQRCLWASTSTKNPEYRDVIYVEELIGPDTVDTMPRETVEAVQDHGRVERTLDRDVDGARRTLEAFADGRDRLRRRRADARARGRREVRQLLQRAVRRPRGQARPARGGMTERLPARAGAAAARGLGPRQRRRRLRPPDLVDVGGRPDRRPASTATCG